MVNRSRHWGDQRGSGNGSERGSGRKTNLEHMRVSYTRGRSGRRVDGRTTAKFHRAVDQMTAVATVGVVRLDDRGKGRKWNTPSEGKQNQQARNEGNTTGTPPEFEPTKEKTGTPQER